MQDQELIEQASVLQPDLVALIRAIFREELKALADVIRRTNIEQNSFLEKQYLPEYKKHSA